MIQHLEPKRSVRIHRKVEVGYCEIVYAKSRLKFESVSVLSP